MIGWIDILESREFRLPLAMAALILGGLFFHAPVTFVFVGLLGMAILIAESYDRMRRGRFVFDYLALLTLALALVIGNYLVASIIALMVAVGTALEAYGTRRAEKTLRGLFNAIPKKIMLETPTGEHDVAIQAVRRGDIIVLRKGEMLPFEGTLLSLEAVFDESPITGEMEPVVHEKGSILKAGFVNTGAVARICALGDFEHSSYRRILSLVEEGKRHSAPLARLSERSNVYFTLFVLLLSGLAYLVFQDVERVLAVLVIATPCPLLIAAPMSFIGGLNKAARKNIIIKSPFVLELLAKTKTLFFDKTGTLTLGEPVLRRIEIFDRHLDEEEALNVAASLERHSIHPLAKAVLRAHRERKGEILPTDDVTEHVGQGIEGRVHGTHFRLAKSVRQRTEGIEVDLLCHGKRVATFYFDDVLKPAVGEVFQYLKARGYATGIITGDSAENARRLLGGFGVRLYTRATPIQKASLIRRYQRERGLVGMVGDGLNDAPALVMADLGIVFSGTETSATTEAADVAILERDAEHIKDAIHIGRRSYRVALQSVTLGIGLSTAGMLFAFFGYIDPVHGAMLQELIDFFVIMNALRSTY